MKKFNSELYNTICKLFREMDFNRVETVNDEENGRTYTIKLYTPDEEDYHDLWDLGIEVNCLGFDEIFTVGDVCCVGAYGYNSILSASVDVIELMTNAIEEKFDDEFCDK